ncbi:CypX Cytochrome P450 [Pyrenophora tritici-repentis]|uniref:CypX, Cytochrome P450 n=2 Tax=Pyrenophora tritici-repentis TaxID=45151 RepID=A0A2W1D026_9PLEO|nr:cytochrome P450 3A17 [Pyrenophora tritici-repentis Pt-1C-BFP]KAA8617321.1 Cytochrome p450 3a17 [Pyrenophora tritici-repentis]EDU46123.1 cytochrome P450 3A17 [Pyrenophora tritici-repentis Pt-1C-BFP]KAF7446614.1 Cytochrome p450 3a17 [Pyrenophora tritici-repentis]KAF7567652.1 CypX, Cytochrome P450 [Pyrenophora tritici-repentis]KAG9382271.1 Cytochrome p450 3a17 [Pyrenophora tritici-repentis]
MWYHQALAAVLLLLEICVVYALGLAIYRLYVHPLRKTPGPWHFAVSGLPLVIENQLKGRFVKTVLQLHEKYGDIVRTGPNSLSINGTIGWSEVFGFGRSNQPEFSHYDDFYQIGDKSNLSIFPSDRESHRRQRRILAHAFSDAAIKEQEALIMQYVDKLFVHLRKDAAQHQPTDMVKWFNFTTFDIIGDLAFGEPFDCLENSDYHPWVAMIFLGLKGNTQMLALLKMPALSWILRLVISKENMQKRLESKAMTDKKVEKRLALGSAPNGRKDFMTYILRHNDEKGMSHQEILGNSEALIVAGSETTASALSGLTYYITTNPQALERLQHEIRTAFSTEKEITMLSTAHLKYLTACIEEALRVYPPAPETPPRVSPGEYVNGYYIPKGTLITIFQWAVYHNPNNFVQPDAFIPERWLSPNHPFHDPQFNADKKAAFQPFSFGPRNCIGKNLAYNELRLIAARLFWNFDFVLQPESQGWPDKQKAFTVWEKIPLFVQLKQVERD